MQSESLKRLHDTQVELLNEIVRVCDKHNLQYYLIGGTLLGAVRHKGFIPWDDDLDIAMPRKDYNKLTQEYKSEIDPRYFLQTNYTDHEYPAIFGKLRKNNTLFLETISKTSQCHHGIFIDIFPLDYREENESWKIKMYVWFAQELQKYLNKRAFHLEFSYKAKLLVPILNKMTIAQICSIRDWCFSRADPSKSKFYVNYGSQRGIERQTIPIEKYEPSNQLAFEGNMYRVPRDYTYCMRRIFGENYMQLPPEEKRETHNPERLSFDLTGLDERL